MGARGFNNGGAVIILPGQLQPHDGGGVWAFLGAFLRLRLTAGFSSVPAVGLRMILSSLSKNKRNALVTVYHRFAGKEQVFRKKSKKLNCLFTAALPPLFPAFFPAIFRQGSPGFDFLNRLSNPAAAVYWFVYHNTQKRGFAPCNIAMTRRAAPSRCWDTAACVYPQGRRNRP